MKCISSSAWTTGTQVPLERAGAKRVEGKPPVSPSPSPRAGRHLDPGAAPRASPSSFIRLAYVTPMRSRSSRGRPRNAPAAFVTRSHFGHIPVILVPAQVSARNGAALMRWSLSYHKARS